MSSVRFAKGLLTAAAVILAVLTIAPVAIPQPSSPPAKAGPQAGKRRDKARKRPRQRKPRERKARQRLGKLRRRVLRKKVGLSDAKIEQVVTVLEGRQTQRRALERQVRASRRAIGELFKTDSQDQRAYAEHLDTLQQAHRGLASLRDEQVTELRQVLEPKQQAKLFRAMEIVKRRFNSKRQSRRARQGRRGRRR